MHGGERLKHTSFLTNVAEFQSLGVTCDGAHEHRPWGMVGPPGEQQFATASEAAYPKQLCEAISECLKLRARALGYTLDSLVLPSDAASRIAAQKQPRKNAGKPIMSEFKYTQTISSDTAPVLGAKSMLTAPFGDVPLHSKLIRRMCKQGEKGPFTCYTFGVYRDPVEFMQEALKLRHPFDTTCALPDPLLRALAFLLQNGPLETMKYRLKTLQKWRKWEKELSMDEDVLHSQLHPAVAKVLHGKKLLLLEKIATDIGWKDVAVHREIRNGFRLTGNPEPSGIFESDFKPALLEERELFAKMKYMKHALWAKIKNSPQQDFTEDLWNITLEECDSKQWLQGPFTWEQLEDKYNGDWLPCRRFAVWQSSKWRPIDDFPENGVNSAYSVCEKIHLRALDETIWIAMTLMRAMRDKGYFEFALADGSVLTGMVHRSWTRTDGGEKPHIKTMDLKSAYKQWALAPCEISKAILTLKHPESNVVYGFECLTLPFGSVASVICFNRIARLYQRILNEVLVLATNYFDDYPIIELGYLAKSTESTLKAVADLLGFNVAYDKDLPFSRRADLLGVTLNLEDDTMQCVKVSNKQSRVLEMSTALQKIISERCIFPAMMPSMFGRLQFCEAQILGRQGRLAMADLRILERSASKKVSLSQDHIDAFESLMNRLTSGTPRTIMTTKPSTPCLVFTDGACEPNGDSFIGSIGGVLVIPTEGSFAVRAFGCYMDESVMRGWSNEGKKHLIGPVELYAVAMARTIWSKFLCDRSIFFVDHGGVLASLISGAARDSIWRVLLLEMERSDSALPSMSWFARVASASNIGDGPSRGNWEWLRDLPYERDHPVCFLCGKLLKPT
eukprot:s333_g31.t1